MFGKKNILMARKQEDMAKDKRGGARAGAGRKRMNKTMLHTYIDTDFLAKLKEIAKAEKMTVGDWLVRNVQI